MPESLEHVLGPRVPAVVLSLRAQNPTGAAISERRAADLVRVLRQRPQALLVEIDDSAAVSGSPLVTLTGGMEHWAVVRSTSKWLGPDLRVAVTTGDAVTIARLQRRQVVNVRWVSHLLQNLTLALWSDPSNAQPTVDAQYRWRQSDALVSLHAPTLPRMSLATSWLEDPAFTWEKAFADAYTDFRWMTYYEFAPTSLAGARAEGEAAVRVPTPGDRARAMAAPPRLTEPQLRTLRELVRRRRAEGRR